MRKLLAVFCLTIAAGAASSMPVKSLAAETDELRRIDEVTCKDIMRTSGEDRVIALALLHGYFLGKKGMTTMDAEAMGQVSDEFIEYCLDHPGDPALASFEAIAE
jgi:hypothetical protein